MATVGTGIARILVALDAETSNRTTVEAAVRFAEEFQAELVGLFVTETDMLNLASLPLARHLIGHSMTAQTLEAGALERAMRILADQARADLAAAAESRHVKWSFRSVSGSSEEAVVTETMGFDVVMFGRSRRHRAVAWATRTRCGVLVATPEVRTGRPIVLWMDDGDAAFDIALRLARQSRVKLLILVPDTGSPERVEDLAHTVATAGVRGEIRPVSSKTSATAFRELRLAHPGLLIVSRSSPIARHEDFEGFVDNLDCTIFLTA